ncbi:MAG: LPS export ABC transporter permease LptG [bacterium]
MKTLRRYLVKEYLKIIFLLQLVFVVIYLVVDLYRIDRFLEFGAGLSSIVSYYFYKIPLTVFQTVPVAVLIGTLILIGRMAKSNEITILKAGGINLMSVVYPLLVIAAFISISIFLFNEFLVSAANKQVAYIERVKIKKKPPRSLFSDNWIWFRNKDGLFYNIKEISSNSNMFGVSIFTFDDRFKVRERIDAQRMRWDGKNWRLEQVRQRSFHDRKLNYQSFPELVYDKSTDRPRDFDQVKIKPELMNYRELTAYVDSLKTKGFKTSKYEVEIQTKFAHPLISLVMVLLAIPFTLTSRRSGGLVLNFSLGIAVGFVYWVFLAAGYALGRGGALSPMLAGWMGNVIFSVFGIYRLTKVNQ